MRTIKYCNERKFKRSAAGILPRSVSLVTRPFLSSQGTEVNKNSTAIQVLCPLKKKKKKKEKKNKERVWGQTKDRSEFAITICCNQRGLNLMFDP